MAETREFQYHLSEEGTLRISGEMPDFLAPEDAPYYKERERILAVVAAEGATVGANAFGGYPRLRTASLVGARRIGTAALYGCPRLASVSFSPSATSVAHNAFAECPRLVFVDFSGDEAALDARLPVAHLLQEGRLVRTVPAGEGETLAAGELGGGYWCLTEDGTLTVDGDDIPDCRYLQDAPWHPHRAKVRRVIVGGAVGRIGERAFSAMPNLIYAAVVGNTEVGAFAFSSCSRLFEIVLFPGVHTLGTCALAGTAPTALFLGGAVRDLPTGLVQSCRSLKTLLLPVLPLRSSVDLTVDCKNLREIKYLGPTEEIDAMMKNPAVVLSRRPVPVWETLSPKAAEEALDKAEAGRVRVAALSRKVEEGHTEAEALCAAVYERIGATEAAYVRDEACRLAFAKPVRRGREERRALRRERRALLRTSRKLNGRLSRLAKEAARLERTCRRTERCVTSARGEIFSLYPFGSTLALRADGIAAYTRTAGVCPSRAYVAAAARAKSFAEMFTYHRYGEVRFRYTDLDTLMEGLTPVGHAGSRRVPRILVAGAQRGEDAGAEACAYAIRRAGGIAVLASGRPTDLGFDGLVLCDGGPVDPLRYDERRRGMPVDERRDTRDGALFDAFYLYGKPILGIGRGCELLNVRLGGTLNRTLSEKSAPIHKGGTVHPLIVDPQSYLYKIYKPAVRPMHVRSDHAGGLARLGRGLVTVGRTEDGVIEAVIHTKQPIFGVMFSPERMPALAVSPFAVKRDIPENGDLLFAHFCAEAKRSKENPLSKRIGKRYFEE